MPIELLYYKFVQDQDLCFQQNPELVKGALWQLYVPFHHQPYLQKKS